ncbi:MAG TPA: hypothetical protein VI756_09490 [Blastocatellia bacterium]
MKKKSKTNAKRTAAGHRRRDVRVHSAVGTQLVEEKKPVHNAEAVSAKSPVPCAAQTPGQEPAGRDLKSPVPALTEGPDGAKARTGAVWQLVRALGRRKHLSQRTQTAAPPSVSPSFRRSSAISLAACICLLAALAVSSPLRRGVSHAWSVVAGGRGASSESLSKAFLNVEQRAQSAAGWNLVVRDSVSKGTITYYDRSGAATGTAALTLYVSYPDRVRVEIDRGAGATETAGFDQQSAWSSTNPALSDIQSRDILDWLRTRPERFFYKYAMGSAYREVGSILDEHIPGRPWHAAEEPDNPARLDQVELIDDLFSSAPMAARTAGQVGASVSAGAGTPGSQPSAGSAAHTIQARTYYYIDRKDSTVRRAKWMEPQETTQDRTNGIPTVAIQVDFGDYRKIGGLQVPFDVVHWWGGKVVYRLTFSSVRLSQSLPDSLFQHQ